MSFTRLALIDPEGGRQPFVSDDGMVILAANGEIYNHRELAKGLKCPVRFRSRSDSEVLLYLYLEEGLGSLDRVRGMFGIAVIDLGEDLHSVASWNLSYELSPETARSRYLAAFSIGPSGQLMVGLSFMTAVVLPLGIPGWALLGAAFALGAFAVRTSAAAAPRGPGGVENHETAGQTT